MVSVDRKFGIHKEITICASLAVGAVRSSSVDKD